MITKIGKFNQEAINTIRGHLEKKLEDSNYQFPDETIYLGPVNRGLMHQLRKTDERYKLYKRPSFIATRDSLDHYYSHHINPLSKSEWNHGKPDKKQINTMSPEKLTSLLLELGNNQYIEHGLSKASFNPDIVEDVLWKRRMYKDMQTPVAVIRPQKSGIEVFTIYKDKYGKIRERTKNRAPNNNVKNQDYLPGAAFSDIEKAQQDLPDAPSIVGNARY